MKKVVKNNNASASDHTSGCMICGRELYYSTDVKVRIDCYYCGQEEITNVFCLEGHYVCDECHRKDVLDIVKQICIDSDSTDPVKLALEIFDLKYLHMHGPEYHSIVPAILVATYGNCINKKEPALIEEAIERGKAVPGGACGFYGTCGAGIGVGIAYSIIKKITPYSRKDRGDVNQMTANALLAISQYLGPRCCKRDCILAIESAKKKFGFSNSCGESKYICSQYPDNNMCIHDDCPFYPNKD